MKANPDMKLYVDGHSDSKGKFDYNMDLSLRRAKAVVEKPTRTCHFSTDRLKANGVKPPCPVLSNKNEKGRAKCRATADVFVAQCSKDIGHISAAIRN